MKKVHLPSALSKNQYGVELAEVSVREFGSFSVIPLTVAHQSQDNSSHFYESLNHWRELNLTHAFSQFTREVQPLSASMPLLLHNWQEVVKIWMAAVETADDEGLKPLLEYVLAHFLVDRG